MSILFWKNRDDDHIFIETNVNTGKLIWPLKRMFEKYAYIPVLRYLFYCFYSF